MFRLRRSPERVHGHVIPAPRLTRKALVAFLAYVAAPALLVLLMLDVALYFAFRNVFGLCYGVLCWMQ
jgi:hypothetical protein